MAKFQVVKCSPMANKPGAQTSWRATMVKGLFTGDDGEVDMFEVMLFPERGEEPVTYKAGEQLIPVVGVRTNRATSRPELVITAFKLSSVASATRAA